MSTTPKSIGDPVALERAAKDHLWMHFTRLSSYEKSPVPILVRGDGCYLEDLHGHRLLDGLAGLFTVQLGYSFGEEIGEAAAEQMRELPFYTNWSYGHPRAIELAEELAGMTPGDLNRVFFTNSGSEAVETAWKLARQYHSLRGERRWKVIARDIAYHGSTMGALAITGLPVLREPFEPLVPQVNHVRTTNRYHRPDGETEAEFTAFLLDDMRHVIEAEGPDSIAMVILEPVQNAGGAYTPPAGYFAGVRELCDRYGILLCADEVITGFGRFGEWWASDRYGIEPDLITCAKGLSSAYGAIGAMIASDRIAAPFLEGDASFLHGATFGGHPVQAAIALRNLEIIRREEVVEHVRDTEGDFLAALEPLREVPIVGDLRGAGFFYALELVRDRDTKEPFTDAECEDLLRGFLSPRLYEAGLICRADDRADPVVMLSPPLVAGQDEFDVMAGILGEVLTEAADRFR